jgi:hypothetical protein
MDYASAHSAGDQTVQVRVQVVDLQSFTLDLQLPSYLPAQDLTQRIARDAGLDAHWDNGQRRLYWLRARGRLLQSKETLGDLGVITGELVYLLPEPPPGSGVVEQDPDYPETRGYAGSGIPTLLVTLALITAWAAMWGLLLTIDRSIWAVIPPGLGLGLMCCSFARHAWGGSGSHPRVAFTGLVLCWMLAALALVLGWGFDQVGLFTVPLESQPGRVSEVFGDLAPGVISGMVGVFVGWLAWWGAVEPLPERRSAAAADGPATVTTVACGICRGDVTPDVRLDCPYRCGQHFHVGCHRARVSVYRGDPGFCAVCNARVA